MLPISNTRSHTRNMWEKSLAATICPSLKYIPLMRSCPTKSDTSASIMRPK